MKLPIHERFFTWQGEGAHLGRSAYFIRTFGCPVHCPWCDSAGTWHPDYIPKKIERLDPEVLAQAAVAEKPDIVVVTGGEPAVHDLAPLTDALHARGLPVHLETSGAFPIKGDIDWITLSPKRWQAPLDENIDRANEFKLIVDNRSSITEWTDLYGARFGERSVWLHPEWSQHQNAEILNLITNWVKQHGAPYRAGWQLHKLYAVDQLDAGSRKAVPLGGDPERGL